MGRARLGVPRLLGGSLCHSFFVCSTHYMREVPPSGCLRILPPFRDTPGAATELATQVTSHWPESLSGHANSPCRRASQFPCPSHSGGERINGTGTVRYTVSSCTDRQVATAACWPPLMWHCGLGGSRKAVRLLRADAPCLTCSLQCSSVQVRIGLWSIVGSTFETQDRS
jgi:hypothetical protein